MADSPEPKLAEYRRKRDFAKTPEPDGHRTAASGQRFSVQMHSARQLHFDFRLELDGVLVSWAIPKGPSLKANEKRLAVRTEDHPLDYGDFEGVIPEAEYGGGTVLLWDRGSWRPDPKEGDPREGLRRGKLVVHLEGQKLRGAFHMVRTKGTGKAENWIIFKGRDPFARDQPDVLEENLSVLSGRTLRQIADHPARVWRSGTGEPTLIDLVKQLPTTVKFTNLDKVLYPEVGLTKAAVIAYWAAMADRILPFLAERPVSLLRCPDGWQWSFFQKHGAQGVPPELGRVGEYLKVIDQQSLIALGQLGVLELHPWGCHADDLEAPDLLVMDLDPDPSLPWSQVTAGALELRRRLADRGLTSFVKTTGGKGAHVVLPLVGLQWEAFKGFSHDLAVAMAKDSPHRFTANPKKSARTGKIFIDYLRNSRGATSVAAYSPRAREGAPVSCPITWEELPGVDPRALTVQTVPTLRTDPWAGWKDVERQRLR